MTWIKGLAIWLEHRGLRPAYGGGVLLGLAIFFFAAATNTLAGWLYVMSGVLLALLAIAARLPLRHLQGLTLSRPTIEPVSVGQSWVMELNIHNPQPQPKGLFQVIDQLPRSLGSLPPKAIRTIAPGQTYTWQYRLTPQRRGIYSGSTVILRSAAPLGLFWGRREIRMPTRLVVYPQILALQHCPILDTLGDRSGQQWHYRPVVRLATEGLTRSLRPYRWGDPTRLIHWRTSARYGELQVRELEKVTASQAVVIALDTRPIWSAEAFEQAVVAAASLYHYALKRGLAAALWLPPGELLQDRASALSALAAVEPQPTSAIRLQPPDLPLIWLTAQGSDPAALPPGRCQIIWGSNPGQATADGAGATLWIAVDQPLAAQIQASPPSSPKL
ncbi:MAG TPA: DUF58 domain-containing protein [Leptolyngbyaceae cyanobacterium M65_K2018_010]|nr:DUF58 domain-containing protein [Leptolyngbyaceae cyanobacterium M65_K2018_010]